MKLLQELLTEAYHEISDSITGLDRDFADYALNEYPLGWDTHEIDQARQQFGGVDVGRVYRGIKIHSAEQLQEVTQLSEGGGYVDMRLESASPEWGTAASFANYVKSYDELTMMRELNRAIKNGSAGAFGTAILTLEPSANQVIVKTYTSGNEIQHNPNWRAPERSAEAEVILYGKIKCVGASIIPPLTKANWKETLLTTIKSVQQIADWSLLDQWLDANGVTRDELSEVSNKVWAKVIRTERDLIDAMNCSRLHPVDYIKSQPKLMKWLTKHLVRDNNQFYVDLDGERIQITRNTYFANQAWLRGTHTVDGKVTKNIHMIEQKLIDSLKKYVDHLGNPGIDWSNSLYTINADYSIPECVSFVQLHGKKLTNRSEIQQMLATIENNINGQLKFMTSYVANVHKDPDAVIGQFHGIDFAHDLRQLLALADVFPKLNDGRKRLINAIYNIVPGGAMDDKKRALLNWYTQHIGSLLK